MKKRKENYCDKHYHKCIQLAMGNGFTKEEATVYGRIARADAVKLWLLAADGCDLDLGVKASKILQGCFRNFSFGPSFCSLDMPTKCNQNDPAASFQLCDVCNYTVEQDCNRSQQDWYVFQ